MSGEIFNDLTFFNAIVNAPQLQEAENKGKNEKKGRKSPSPRPTVRKARTSKSPQDENSGPRKPRCSKKGERQPLGSVNGKEKQQKKDGEESTKGRKNAAPTRQTKSLKAMPSEEKAKPARKERQSMPKIVVREDTPPKEKKGEEKKERRTTKGRRSLQEAKTEKEKSKSPNDPAKAAGKKSPSSGGNRLPRCKEGQAIFEEMLKKLEGMFPNVDPDFVKSQLVKMKGSVPETIEFLIIKEKTGELPSRVEYVRRQEAEKLQNRFLDSFSVENFLKMIPDPWEHFLRTEKHSSVNYLGHSLHYLKNKYKKHYVHAIHAALANNGNSLYLADKELKKKNRMTKTRATNRSKYECEVGRPTTFNIQFVHEVAFIENEAKIKAYVKKAKAARSKKFKEAQEAGNLLECQSCNDVALLQDDAVHCPANHVFCKDCVVKYVQIEIERNNFQLKCLVKCEEQFSMKSLQTVLSPFVMAKIISRNQLEEIKSAGIQDLVCCPFCYTVTIIPPEISVFKCLNPSCMIESCRFCKQLNHTPFKCQELEEFDKTILEVEVEVQEDEDADLSIKCGRCNGEFVKVEDTNRMVCPCGSTICSVCRQPVPGCPHFVPVRRLSQSSDESEYPGINEDASGDAGEGSSEPEANFMEFLPSESDTF